MRRGTRTECCWRWLHVHSAPSGQSREKSRSHITSPRDLQLQKHWGRAVKQHRSIESTQRPTKPWNQQGAQRSLIETILQTAGDYQPLMVVTPGWCGFIILMTPPVTDDTALISQESAAPAALIDKCVARKQYDLDCTDIVAVTSSRHQVRGPSHQQALFPQPVRARLERFPASVVPDR